MKLRLTTPIPRLADRTCVPVQLVRDSAETLNLKVVSDWSAATHQMAMVLGAPLLVHRIDSDEIISGTICREGFWEFAESMLLLSVVRPGMTILDIGANVGYYAMILASLVGPHGRIHAFEPDPENFQLLAANLLLRSRLDPVPPVFRFRQLAISDRIGMAALERASQNLGLHHLIAEPTATSVPVEVTTVDRLRGDGEIASPVGLIKADIQGSELAMLRGAEQTIQADHPMLVLEFEPYISGAETCRQLLDWLRDHGYDRVRLFKSDRHDPSSLLAEFARSLSLDEVAVALRQDRIGPYCTLFAD